MEKETKCLHCGSTKTPQWRAGPLGPKTLCNACGVRYRSGRLCPEYRPAKSPTFLRQLHSNSHKEVLKIRSKKQQGDKGRFAEMNTEKSQDADTTIKKEASMEGDLNPLYNESMKAPEVGPSKQSPSESKDERGKIQWDAITTKIYCRVCAEEVNAGNEPSKIGWRNVAAKFNARANGNYDTKQLICKWYELKNDWLLWKQLVGQETNLMCDHKIGKINASARWWYERIQANPEVAKFREGGLENLTEMNIMFSEVLTAGEKRCLRPRGLVLSKQDVRGEGVIKLEEVGNSNNIMVNLLSSKCQSARINKKRKKTTLDGEKSNKKQVQKGKGKNAKVETDTPGCSVLECMALLRSLPGLEQGSELFMLGTRLFIKQDYREMFVSLQRADTQLAWLKQELERERASGKRQ